MAVHNPFTPGFGTFPPVLAGRENILNPIRVAFESGPKHPQFTSLLIGVRGSGKTVTLDAIQDLASEQGWLVLPDDASRTGLVERLTRSTVDMYAALGDNKRWNMDRAIFSAGVPGLVSADMRLGRSPQPDKPFDFRSALTALAERLARRESGLLITVDELHNIHLDEMREIGAVIQHVTRRESRPVAFIGAALPDIEEMLLADKKAAFLQRLARFPLEPLGTEAATRALSGGFEKGEAAITPEVLRMGVNASDGYPYMVQLIGWHCWDVCNDPTVRVTFDDMRIGIAEADRQIGDLVLKPLWRYRQRDLQMLLLVMAEDEDESRLNGIANKLHWELDWGDGYPSIYGREFTFARQRLIR